MMSESPALFALLKNPRRGVNYARVEKYIDPEDNKPFFHLTVSTKEENSYGFAFLQTRYYFRVDDMHTCKLLYESDFQGGDYPRPIWDEA